MKVIVGCRELWATPALASKVLALMVSTDEDIAVRCDSDGAIPSSTEELAIRIGDRVGRRVIRFQTSRLDGSKAGFSRDVRLVKAASGVYAFFGAEGPVEGGTAHVVACALREGLPVVAYGLADDGNIIEIGSDAGEFYRMERPSMNMNGFTYDITEEVGWRT